MFSKMLTICALSTALLGLGAAAVDAQEFPDGTVYCGARGILNLEGTPCSVSDWYHAAVYVPRDAAIGVYQDDDGGGRADPSKDGQASTGGGTNWGGGWWGYLPKDYGRENQDYNDASGPNHYGGYKS